MPGGGARVAAARERARLPHPARAAAPRGARRGGHKLREKYQAKLRTLGERVRKAEQARGKQEDQVKEKQTEAAVTIGASVLGALLGTKVVSAANAQRAARAVRGVKKASAKKADVERAEADLAAAQAALAEVEAEVQAKLQTLASAFDPATVALERATVAPKKTHIEVVAFGLGFLPYRPDASGQYRPAWPGLPAKSRAHCPAAAGAGFGVYRLPSLCTSRICSTHTTYRTELISITRYRPGSSSTSLPSRTTPPLVRI